MSAIAPAQSRSIPDLLAPAGDWDCAKAAIENGADAIYFGLDQFNARMRAQNFTEADLAELMPYLHRRGVKGYVTLNTLIFPQELDAVERLLKSMISYGVDAVIVQDVGICRLIRHLSPDFPIHASTQMTVTSAAGVTFAKALGCELVVLARETSLKDLRQLQTQLMNTGSVLPLEVFVHGALCVAYSGQCLTSEALGGRSANRGECAQACRMPYNLIVDGKPYPLEDRKYLLSPQDLVGLEVLPELIQAGIHCLKIEGRLKTPDYVATVTRIYRQALDRYQLHPSQAIRPQVSPQVNPQDWYELEMSFSRGLYSGWFEGVNHQALVHGRFGKKRGVYLGVVTRIKGEQITLKPEAPLKPGDGIVFDNGHPEQAEEGGRIYRVNFKGAEATLEMGKGRLNLNRIHVGDRVWKTSDPELEKRLKQQLASATPQFQRSIDLEVLGKAGQPLTIIVRDEWGHVVQVNSGVDLIAAHSKPLTTERLQEQLGRLGQTPFKLGTLINHLEGSVLLPVSELNRLRRTFVEQLETLRAQPKRWQLHATAAWRDLLLDQPLTPQPTSTLVVLVRRLDQIQAVLAAGVTTLYCEFEDPRTYRQAVQQVRAQPADLKLQIWVAPPRITKPGETWILKQVQASEADGYLIRNYDHLEFFADQPCIGDFSFNIANPLTAAYFKQQYQLQRLTASYDLNSQQLEDLLNSCPPDWFEITIHQQMPMFHMEHCVFCAFLSTGTDYRNCGRPCETYEVKLQDRTGIEHPLQADAGCRNTVFNGRAQTGAESVHRLIHLGARWFRLEFVEQTPDQIKLTIQWYQNLLAGKISGTQLWQALKLQHQLGVTRGTVGTRS